MNYYFVYFCRSYSLLNNHIMKNSSKIWLGITGILWIVLGVLCIASPQATLVSMAVIIGCFTLSAGISRLAFTLRTQRFLPNSGTRMLSALLQILIGIIFLCNIVGLAISLPFIFALWVMVESIMLIVQSFDYKQVGFSNWWIILLIGIAGVVLGGLGLYHLDISGITLTWIFGIGLILIGAAYLTALFGIKRFEKALGFSNYKEVKE